MLSLTVLALLGANQEVPAQPAPMAAKSAKQAKYAPLARPFDAATGNKPPYIGTL